MTLASRFGGLVGHTHETCHLIILHLATFPDLTRLHAEHLSSRPEVDRYLREATTTEIEVTRRILEHLNIVLV